MKDIAFMCNILCVCVHCVKKNILYCTLHMFLFIVYFLIHVVYGDDVEKTLREDESKTLINSRKILEILIFILRDKQN